MGGSLTVELKPGFQPFLGETFTALTFGSRSGDFTSYNGLAVGGHMTLHHSFVGNSLTLTTRPTVDGDANTDGIVNGLDIALAASHWLQISIVGDANGDSTVDGLDIALMASNWLAQDIAGGAASAVAVPEPGTFCLFASAAVIALTYMSRQVRARSGSMRDSRSCGLRGEGRSPIILPVCASTRATCDAGRWPGC